MPLALRCRNRLLALAGIAALIFAAAYSLGPPPPPPPPPPLLLTATAIPN